MEVDIYKKLAIIFPQIVLTFGKSFVLFFIGTSCEQRCDFSLKVLNFGFSLDPGFHSDSTD